MCGICGVVGDVDRETLIAMTDTMRHRGPDGGGVVCFEARDGRPAAGLGHRRLSIIDPTVRGRQPMTHADSRYWITFNGEIYNYRELRAPLERAGMRFESGTDTEVLLALFATEGEAMLERLNGIFAFAIWDRERGRLFMARDRMGVKPLYWALDGNSLLFASEVKALLPALPQPRLRRDRVADYLAHLWVPEPDTLFDGIYMLAPGHCATFDGRAVEVRQYWDLTFAPEERSEDEWIETLRRGVDEAVERQLVADVPLGGFLSGGVDSGAVVATMLAKQGRATTYTIGFRSEDLRHDIIPDDLRYARGLASSLGVENHERVLLPDIVDLLPRLTWHMDVPVADPALISSYLVCAAARERLTVILSGMGADEIFAGYPRHVAARIGRTGDLLPAGVRRALARAVTERLTIGGPGRWRAPRRNLIKLARGFDLEPIERYLVHSSSYVTAELERLLMPDVASRASHVLDCHRKHAERVAGEDWLNQLLYVDMKTYLPSMCLQYTDKMSMAASTEVRVPLLDDELVELSARIPPSLKLHGWQRKYVFKRSAESLLPQEVIWRRKAGFGAPIRAWLVGELAPLVSEMLAPDVIAERGLVRPREVAAMIADNSAGRADNALRIWALLTLELWQRTFIDDPVAGTVGGIAAEPTLVVAT
jgi:asparagine synthase (glutamine-hydrolysing)